MPELGDHWYEERIKTLRNRIIIALELIDKPNPLATITEDIYEDAQWLVLEYCVKEAE